MANIFSTNALRSFLLITGLFCLSLGGYAQNKTKKDTAQKSVAAPEVVPDTSKTNLLLPVTVKDTGKNAAGEYLTLQQCIDYAMKHQPALNVSVINIDVAKTTNAISLAGALPQVNASGDLIHYIQQQQKQSGNCKFGYERPTNHRQ